MVRLGKAESAHPHIKNFHIDAVAERSSRDESRVERVKGEASDRTVVCCVDIVKNTRREQRISHITVSSSVFAMTV